MSKTVLYSPYYLESYDREYDLQQVATSRGGRSRYGTEDPQEALKNRREVILRAKKRIRRYTMHNFLPGKCHLITFTYRNDIQIACNLQEASKEFKERFLKRLRHQLKRIAPSNNFKFIYVAEFHKQSDKVHFHMISDIPKWIIKKLPVIWKSGFIDSALLKETDDLRRASKYLCKSLDDPRLGTQVHLYWKSRNVVPPKKINDPFAVEVLCELAQKEAELTNITSYRTDYQGNTLHKEWFFNGISLDEHLKVVNWT